jgi:dTDP-4-amino-4,6-dideoxygalactose transaminase
VRAFCDRHGLALIEDCSHAHGAKVNGRYVGTFGEASAWSLQTQKIIAAGEGGIMLTNSRELYDKAQLLGHFNKRAQKEMDPAGPLYEYASTGLGLKYRAHPLGIAFALGQLPHLTEWVSAKQRNAERRCAALSTIPGAQPLGMSDDHRTSAYYALAFRLANDAFSREELVAAMHREGFLDVDIPASTAGLHTFAAFQKPLSPVAAYDRNAVAFDAYPVTDLITRTLIKVSVPACVGDGGEDEDERFLAALDAVLETVLGDLVG